MCPPKMQSRDLCGVFNDLHLPFGPISPKYLVTSLLIQFENNHVWCLLKAFVVWMIQYYITRLERLHGLCMWFIFRLFSDFLPHLCHIDLIPTVTPQWAYGVINVTGNYSYICQLFLFSFHLVYINDHKITECVSNLKLICSTRAIESVSDILFCGLEAYSF